MYMHTIFAGKKIFGQGVAHLFGAAFFVQVVAQKFLTDLFLCNPLHHFFWSDFFCREDLGKWVKNNPHLLRGLLQKLVCGPDIYFLIKLPPRKYLS